MKTLIISDVHSNIVALEKVWKKESDSDQIVSAGDVVDCGPFPCECIDWMIDHDVLAPKGNHDDAVIREYDAVNKSPNWDAHNASLLKPHHILYLRSLPNNLIIDLDGIEHGFIHLYKGYDTPKHITEFSKFSNENFGEKRLKNIVMGHSHQQGLHYFHGNNYWLNPGSVSYRHGEQYHGADYALMINGVITLHHIDFENNKLHQAVKNADVCEAAKQAAYTWW